MATGSKTGTGAKSRRKTGLSDEQRAALVAKAKTDFDDRLARMAAQPAAWVEFIEQVAVFGARYGLSNQLFLLAQAEDRGIEPRFFLPGGNKAGTSGWKAHGRKIRRGEKAFYVWSPIRRRPTEEQATEWEAAGRTVTRDAQGRPTRQVVAFALSPTFELSQTEGEPFEPPTVLRRRRAQRRHLDGPRLLSGEDPTGVYEELVGLIRAEGYTYALVPRGTGYLDAASNGTTVTGPNLRVVQVRDDLDPAQRTKTTMHELAHSRCGHTTGARAGENLHRGRRETEAESVAHIVLRALGLDTADYTDAYVFGWANGDMDLVEECAETVLRVAKQILADLTPPESDPTEADQVDADQADDGPADPAPTDVAQSSTGVWPAGVAAGPGQVA